MITVSVNTSIQIGCCLQVTKELPEAMAVMGFAFYVTPMLLPLRAEMPKGVISVISLSKDALELFSLCLVA